MSLLPNADWKLLRHLHQQIASAQAQRIQLRCQDPPSGVPDQPRGARVLHGWPNCRTISCTTSLEQDDGQRLLAKYLADALQPGSPVQQHIAHDYGFQARYTISSQEAMLPQADGSQQPVLMVLLHGQGLRCRCFTPSIQNDGTAPMPAAPFPGSGRVSSRASTAWNNACTKAALPIEGRRPSLCYALCRTGYPPAARAVCIGQIPASACYPLRRIGMYTPLVKTVCHALHNFNTARGNP